MTCKRFAIPSLLMQSAVVTGHPFIAYAIISCF
uniref:Uncharacterized protein n=1 Tax=Arundo donax TaxID=35708 RepID=A0A0A9HF53_ARUDO